MNSEIYFFLDKFPLLELEKWYLWRNFSIFCVLNKWIFCFELELLKLIVDLYIVFVLLEKFVFEFPFDKFDNPFLLFLLFDVGLLIKDLLVDNVVFTFEWLFAFNVFTFFSFETDFIFGLYL